MNREVWALVLVGIGALGCPAEDRSRTAVTPAAAAVAPSFELDAVVRQLQYGFVQEADAFVSLQQTWEAQVDRAGVLTFAPGHAPEAEARRLGRPLSVQTVAISGVEEPPVLHRGEMGEVRLVRGEVVETLRPGEDGVEQSWTVPSLPEGDGPLIVRVRLGGLSFGARTETGLHFVDPESALWVRYGNATWVSADGTRSAIPARYEDDEVVLEVSRALLEDSTYPAVLDPLVSAQFGPDLPTQAPGMSNWTPDVAFDGNQFLVVWASTRNGLRQIYGARVTPGGAVLDPSGLRIGNVAANQFDPKVVYGDQTFFVTWRQGGGFSSYKVHAARVTTSGTVLDASGIAVTGTSTTNDQYDPAVGFDGTNFVVVWGQDFVSGGRILARRFSPSGAGLDPTSGIVVSSLGSSSWSTPLRAPAVAFDGTNYFVVWQDLGSGNQDLKANRLTPAGVVLDGNGFPIATAPASETTPAVAFNGTDHLVVWRGQTGSDVDLFATRVSPAGAVLDAPPLTISSAPDSQWAPTVASDGTDWLVLWADGRNGTGDLYGTRVSAAGAVLDPAGTPLVIAPGYQQKPSLFWSGTAYLAAWSDGRLGGTALRAARLDGLGTSQDADGFLVSGEPNEQAEPAVGFDGTNFLVVWCDTRSGARNIFGSRVSPSGALLDPVPFPIAPGATSQNRPLVAFNGMHYLVVWGDAFSGMRARRVSPSGVVMDLNDLELPGSGYADDVAALGNDFLVVHSRISHISGVRVSGSGVVLDAAPFTISTDAGSRFLPRAASDGTNWWVVWRDHRSTPVLIHGARVDSAGVVLDPAGIPISSGTGSNLHNNPDLAWNGHELFVVWQESSVGIRGIRLAPTGVALDPAPFTLASSGATALVDFPVVAHDGLSWIVLWQRANYNTSYAVTSRSVQGATVTGPAPTLRAFNTGVSHASHQLYPALASGHDGVSLLAYDLPFTVSGQTVVRVGLRRILQAELGSPCTAAAECTTGFCVDGVCCDSACGGTTVDCQACSVAAGAAVDGTCTVAAAGTVCRAAAGTCDVAEVCSGTSTACPTNVVLPANTVCRAAAGPCDLQEGCSGFSASCPSDAYRSAATVCRPADGPCDKPETCTGSTADCPADELQPDTFVCRSSAGPCDVAETCTGTSKACPTDALAPAGGVCRPSVGACDVEESCTGLSPACPADGFVAAGVVCRASAGVCDLAEVCTGSSGHCPANGFSPASNVCRPAAGPCDRAEFCTGSTAACPDDLLAPAGAVCRPAAGPCDLSETCSGVEVDCPADLFAGPDTVCRPAIGLCDQPEFCTGAGASCPSDVLLPAGTVCRGATGPCDQAEVCDGVAGVCPLDLAREDGAACGDGQVCTGKETCWAGVCVRADPLDCDDGDPCTADLCAEPEGCAHTPIDACCRADADCDDGQPCTTNACEQNRCVTREVPDCAAVPDAGTGTPEDPEVPAPAGCGCSGGAGGGAIPWLLGAALLAFRKRRAVPRRTARASGLPSSPPQTWPARLPARPPGRRCSRRSGVKTGPPRKDAEVPPMTWR
jgi:hypothetical protein